MKTQVEESLRGQDRMNILRASLTLIGRMGMAGSETRGAGTRAQIYDCFIQMVEDSSLAQTHIVDLIKSLGINRNTFYYYFSGKYDLAMRIFRIDLAQALRTSVKESRLISAPISEHENCLEELPYWTHIETGAHELDMSSFLIALGNCVKSKPRFYRMLFDVREREFCETLESLWADALTRDLQFILGGRYMPEETKRMLVALQAQLINNIARYAAFHENDIDALCDDRINPFGNIIQESISMAIQNHPISRMRAPRR